ncbi:ABC transporter permease [Spirosoma foliorum]|uniref:ABC transporter permease n=1 Tax=Spirosoma foliorum TaxID=2710596 RepID=A0A7G5GN45_9BACT|nr:ABC transporter permease [Spirosoma foliorum]QMW00287.1 ABC transporter permease [Spirosoma foliorum]
MRLILTIARFELAYHLRQPVVYLFAVLVFGQGIWYSSQLAALYSYSDPAVTAYLIVASLGVMLAVASVLLAGQSLTKDLDYKTTAYLFSLPITSRMHFAGRFMGTYGAVLLLAMCYLLGIGFHSVAFTQAPTSWLALADGFVRLIAQNCFIAVSLTFSLTVFLRSIRGAYISLFLVVLYFLLTESSHNLMADSDLWKLLDPFGVDMARESVANMPFSDDPGGWLSYSDMFFINRLLWLGLSFGLLAYAEGRFSFEFFASTQARKSVRLDKSITERPASLQLPSVQPRFGGWLSWKTTWRLTKLEFLNLIRQPIFSISVGLLVLLAILLATVLSINPDFPELPVTSRMTALRLPLGIFIGLFLLVMTSELIFNERTTGFWPIYDALPQPNAILLLAKLLAVVGVAALLTIVLFLTSVGIQLGSGFREIDWWRYTADLLTDGFLRYCQLIALGALVATLTNNRIASHVVNLLIFSTLTFLYQINSHGQTVLLYSFLPGSATYSDLIDFGVNAPLRTIVQFVWWGVAGVFLTSFFLTWNRGVVSGLTERVGHWRSQFRWPYQVAFLVFGTLFGLSVWQTHQRLRAVPATQTIQYKSQTLAIQSVTGKPIAIRIHHHHPYQVQHILRATERALHRGEQLFGAYPYADLQISEIPVGIADVSSAPGQILISEKQGWIADDRQPDKLDHIDYLIGREVFKQWLVHQLKPTTKPGDGFIKQGLAEYLALQSVGQQYGQERLQQRLAQRATWYTQSRQRSNKPELPILQSSGNDAVERGRAVLALTSIEQVWGAKPLSFTISQFYQKAIQQPTSATAVAFASELTRQLPDSLDYLKSYLSDQLWFDFKVGRVANLSNGLTVEIITAKWREPSKGQRQSIPMNDYVPLAVLDQDNRVIYSQLAYPNPDERFVSLPPLPNARKVIIDPLGTWIEPNKRDNYKIF